MARCCQRGVSGGPGRCASSPSRSSSGNSPSGAACRYPDSSDGQGSPATSCSTWTAAADGAGTAGSCWVSSYRQTAYRPDRSGTRISGGGNSAMPISAEPATLRKAVMALAGSAADSPSPVTSIDSPCARRRPISSATLQIASPGIGTQLSHGRFDPARAKTTSIIPQGCGSSCTETRSATSPIVRNRIAWRAASRCGKSGSSASRRRSASASPENMARSLTIHVV